MSEQNNVADLITKLDAIADEFRSVRQEERERIVRTAIILIEQLTNEEWHDALFDPPKRSDSYLCCVIIPNSGGGFKKTQRVLYWVGKIWSCEDMIVTHWRETPALPEGGMFHGLL